MTTSDDGGSEARPSSAPSFPDHVTDLSLRRRRWMLLGVAAIIAGAGVAYELALMLLGTVTVGSTERANAVVLGAAMFGMGVGATTGGRLANRPVVAFVGVESLLAVLGAAAAPFLYWSWATLDAFWGPLLAVAFVLGLCIGAEMPLLAALNDRLAEQRASTVVAAFTAADYFGALVGAVAFAFVVRPWIGLVHGTILVAVVNVAMAAAVAVIVPTRRALPVVAIIVTASIGLIAVASSADRVTDNGRQRLYRDPIVDRRESAFQEIIVTKRVHPGGTVDTRLFLDGDLQVSSVDSHRYHESLVHPVVSATSAERVLVLGGGDCVAVREVLRHRSVRHVTLVELDPEVTAVATEVPELRALNQDACNDDRVEVVNADAFTWVRANGGAGGPRFDAVIADFPDPDTLALGRLYSTELYGLVRDLLNPGGAMAVQCGSPFFAPEAFWTCEVTLEAAGWAPTPYHVDVPSFGDWGFHLATPLGAGVALTDPLRPVPVVDGRLPMRFLTAEVLRAAQVFPPDVARERVTVRPSTVLDPSIVEATQGAWIGYS